MNAAERRSAFGKKRNGIPPAVLCLFLLLGASLPLAAQTSVVRFDHFTIEQGLSQNVVNAIAQDREGFLWFGTQDGLNVYDGYGFTQYRHSDNNLHSLTDNFINAMICDRTGTLWVGTMDGLNRFDRTANSFTQYKPDAENPKALAGGVITALCEASAGEMWVGTFNGLYLLNPKQNEFTRFVSHGHGKDGGLGCDSVAALLFDRSGMLWIGTWHGLDVFDPIKNTYRHFKHDPAAPSSLSNDEVYSLYEDHAGTVWAGTMHGLNAFEPQTGTFRHYTLDRSYPTDAPREYIAAIGEDNTGGVWFGTQTGINRYDRRAGTFSQYRHDALMPGSLISDQIHALFVDAGGTVWLGTTKGADRFSSAAHKFLHFMHIPNQPATIANDEVWAISSAGKKGLWVGTSSGLDRYDRLSHTFVHNIESPAVPRSVSRDVILSMAEDESGNYWFGSANGILSRLTPEGKSFRHYSIQTAVNAGEAFPIFSLVPLNRQYMLVGTFKGLYVFLPREEKFSADSTGPVDLRPFVDERILAMYHDPRGELWLGTMDGLIRYDMLRRKMKRYVHTDANDSTSLSHNRVYAIHEGADGTIWLGTHEGLNALNPHNGTIRHYGVAQGMPSGLIYGILEDMKGRLWISTNKGVCRFDPKTGAFRNYDLNDGLQDNEFNQFSFCSAPDGEMFFGGGNGLNSFYPDSIADNPHIPPVRLTSFVPAGIPESVFSLFKFPAGVTAPLDLPWKENGFTCEFIALDFANPEKNRFAYMLEGFDRDWINSGTRRFATYTNLDPGNYTLHVKACNNDGVWNEGGVSLAFSIAPPYWRTLWFRGGVLLAVILMVSFFYVTRVTSVRRRNRILEEKIKARTSKLSETVHSLEEQMAARAEAEDKSLAYQKELQNMTAELSLTEERERRRMASFLHDDIGQGLALYRNKLEALRAPVSPDQIEEFRKEIGLIIEKTRSLTFDLSPPVLYELGLIDAVEWLFEQFKKKYPIAFKLQTDGTPPAIPEEWRYTLFLAIRELIINAIKHAQPKQIAVTFYNTPSMLQITVIDDGAGFNPDEQKEGAEKQAGFGLFNLRERLKMFEGQLTVISQPGCGTSATISIPM